MTYYSPLMATIVQERYPLLHLSLEQAKRIDAFEQDRDSYSERRVLSIWEEWDYQLHVFQEILSKQQFLIYSQTLESSINEYKANLLRIDTNSNIEFYKELLDIHEKTFSNELFTELLQSMQRELLEEKANIKSLKQGYTEFLIDTKKLMLINHFRHYRSYRPNELSSLLLQHKVKIFWPHYDEFRETMNISMKASVKHILETFSRFEDKVHKVMQSKLENIKQEIELKIGNQYPDVSYVVSEGLSAEINTEYELMHLLLYDPQRYSLENDPV